MMIGKEEFRSQREAKEFVREFLDKHQGVIDASHPGFGFMSALLMRHPDYPEKSGPGVWAFRIDGRRTFVIRRDGSEIDFSWNNCVTGRGKTDAADLTTAMRRAIDSQIKEFRAAQPEEFACSLCGKTTQTAKAHVDHVIMFKDLAARFLENKTPPKEFQDAYGYGGKRFRREDEEFELEWAIFHKQAAKLRLLCPPCNLRCKQTTP